MVQQLKDLSPEILVKIFEMHPVMSSQFATLNSYMAEIVKNMKHCHLNSKSLSTLSGSLLTLTVDDCEFLNLRNLKVSTNTLILTRHNITYATMIPHKHLILGYLGEIDANTLMILRNVSGTINFTGWTDLRSSLLIWLLPNLKGVYTFVDHDSIQFRHCQNLGCITVNEDTRIYKDSEDITEELVQLWCKYQGSMQAIDGQEIHIHDLFGRCTVKNPLYQSSQCARDIRVDQHDYTSFPMAEIVYAYSTTHIYHMSLPMIKELHIYEHHKNDIHTVIRTFETLRRIYLKDHCLLDSHETDN